MHPWRIVTLSGSAICALALLLPLASFPVIGPVDGIDGQAWPVFIPIGLILLMVLVAPWREGLPPVPGVTAVILAASAVAFAAVKFADAVVAARDAAGSLGAGSWLLLAGTVVVGIGGVLSLSRKVR